MRLLFSMDAKDYDPNGDAFVRPSVRAVMFRDGFVAMIHSLRFDYYKFPGGGLEKGESHLDCLLRETLEESGLSIIPESVREFGYVHRIQKGRHEAMFIQDNHYYLCEYDNIFSCQHLDAYEEEAEFTLEFVSPQAAIETNRMHFHEDTDPVMLEREALVLERLIEEGYL